MAATTGKLQSLEEIKVDSAKSKIGLNLSFEVHWLTFGSDKTDEVATELSVCKFMTFSGASATSPATALLLSTDHVIEAGYITISSNADSTSDAFRVVLWGYA